MANDYTSSTDAFLDMSEGNYSSSDYPQMATFVTAASRLIDKEMGKEAGFFYPTTDEVTRYYDGSGCETQRIGEWATITTVSMSEAGSVTSTDYTDLGSTDYYVHPYNITPITSLIMDTLNGARFGAWYSYRKGVRVVGIAGYSLTVPELIAQATKIQAIRYFMRGKQGYQDSGASVSFGGMTFKGDLQLDPDVKAMLFPYKLEFS